MADGAQVVAADPLLRNKDAEAPAVDPMLQNMSAGLKQEMKRHMLETDIVSPAQSFMERPKANYEFKDELIEKTLDKVIRFLDDLSEEPKTENRSELMHNLQQLRMEEKECADYILNVAEEMGCLKIILSDFQLPLYRYPAMAERVWEGIANWIRDGGNDDMLAYHTSTHEERKELLPSSDACLLANFLKVNGKAPEFVLERVMEEVIMCEGIGKKKDYWALVRDRNFPHSMEAVYLVRVWSCGESEVSPPAMTFGGREAARNSQTNHDREVASKKSYMWKENPKESKGGGLLFFDKFEEDISQHWSTSKLYGIPVKGYAQRLAMIPDNADHFAFVEPCAPIEHGGFVYLQKEENEGYISYQVLAVNALSWKPTRTAMVFKAPIKMQALMTQEESSGMLETKAIKKRKWAIPVLAGDLQEARVTGSAWVGPGDLEDRSQLGGFAYFFEDPADDCYFEIETVATVHDQANVQKVAGLSDIRTKSLPLKTGATLFAKELGTGNGSLADTDCVAVKFFRVRVTQGFHPIVLYGLVVTPSHSAQNTLAARAISWEAYKVAEPINQLELAAVIVTLISMTQIVRFSYNKDQTVFTRAEMYLFGGIVFADGLLKAWFWCVEFSRFRKWDFDCAYFATPQNLTHIFSFVCQVILFPAVFIIPEDELRGAVFFHWCCAIVSVASCYRLLHLLCLRWMEWGLRILPIIESFGVLGPMAFVFGCFIGASMTASYAVSEGTFSDKLKDTFQMAFAIDYNKGLFLSNYTAAGVNATADQGDLAEFITSWLLYTFFGFLGWLSLNNIFIGEMGRAFDFYHTSAMTILVRERCEQALRGLLIFEWLQLWCPFLHRRLVRQKLDKLPEYIWVAVPRDKLDRPSGAQGLRSHLNRMTDKILTKLDALETALSVLEMRLKTLFDIAPGFEKDNQPSRARPDPSLSWSLPEQN